MTTATSAPVLDPLALLRMVEHRLGVRVRGWRSLGSVPGERLVISVDIGPAPIVVKVVTDGSASAAAATLVALAADSASRSMLLTPRLLFADPAQGVVAMTALEGTPYPDIATFSVLEPALCRAGAATAELHHTRLSSVPLRPTGLTDHLTDLVRPAPLNLADALPGWATVIERAHDLIIRPTLEPGHFVPIHRDLHLRQLVECRDGVGMVDWDLLALGDPAFDVATMLTYLETHLGDLAGPAAEAFLAGYEAAGGVVGERELARYRCFHLLRRACRRFRLRDNGWEAEMTRMLSSLADALCHQEDAA